MIKKCFKWVTGFAVFFILISLSVTAFAGEIVIGFSGPLSGPAAEYGQDTANGIDMAIREINEKGGIVVNGQKHTFKLEKLDDRIDPTLAVNNVRRLKSNGAVAIFNGVFNTISPLMKINEEKNNEFIIMAYTSTPKAMQMGNKLIVCVSVDFSAYIDFLVNWSMKKGLKRCAMMVTLGAYGDEWRQAFKTQWEKRGGTITIDKPANYYTETDFSAPLTAAIATKPEIMLIGGPSATTALVIEQARALGYKGPFMMIDQAKQDIIALHHNGTQLMGNLIGTGTVTGVPYPVGPAFSKKFKAAYKKEVNWECALNYTGMHALSKAIVAAGTTTDIYKIRAAFKKIFPLLGDKYPNEVFGINDAGSMLILSAVNTVTNGISDPGEFICYWAKTKKEYDTVVKTSFAKKTKFHWQPQSK